MTDHSPRPARIRWPLAVIVVVLAVAAHLPAVHSPFQWDDEGTIHNSPMLASPRNASLLFSKAYFRYFGELSYRPVVTASYFLGYQLWGQQPGGYHAVNIGLHAVCSLLVLLLGAELLKRREGAALGACLFAVHPVHCETINVIAFREDLLCTLFFLLSYLLFIRWERRRSWMACAAGILAFALSLLSKEMASVLPLVLALHVLYHCGWKRLTAVVPSAVVLVLYAWVRFGLMQNADEGQLNHAGGSLWTAALTGGWTNLHNLRVLVFPFNLSAEYPLDALSGWGARAAAGAAAVVGLIAIAVRGWRRRAGALCVAWLVVSLLPVSHLIPIANLAADRFLYLPSAAFCLALAALLVTLIDHSRARRPVQIAAPTLIVGCLLLQSVETDVLWNDPQSMWKHSLSIAPRSTVARGNLGGFYIGAGQYEKGIRQCQEVVRRGDRNAPVAAYNIGVAYRELGSDDDAIRAFTSALQFKDDYLPAHYNLAAIYMGRANRDEALTHFNRMLAIQPGHPDALAGLGRLEAADGRHEEAVDHYSLSLAVRPRHTPAVIGLATSLIELKRFDDADAVIRRALPGASAADAGQLYSALGLGAERAGDIPAAIQHYRQSLVHDPTPFALHAVGQLYMRQEKYPEAAMMFRELVRVQPGVYLSHYRLATAAIRLGLTDEARRHLDAALALSPPPDWRRRMLQMRSALDTGIP